MKLFYTAVIFCLFVSCKNEVKKGEEYSDKSKGASTESILSEVERLGVASAVLDRETNDTLIFSEEKHFKNIRQVTFGGDNAEAYWSFDDSKLIFQSNNNFYCVVSYTRRNIFYEASCLVEIARIASDIGIVNHPAFKPLSL